MTVGEFKKRIASIPAIADDFEVMTERGEWGPCRLEDDERGPQSCLRVATVEDSGTNAQNWEVFFPEIGPEEGDRPWIQVLLIG